MTNKRSVYYYYYFIFEMLTLNKPQHDSHSYQFVFYARTHCATFFGTVVTALRIKRILITFWLITFFITIRSTSQYGGVPPQAYLKIKRNIFRYQRAKKSLLFLQYFFLWIYDEFHLCTTFQCLNKVCDFEWNEMHFSFNWWLNQKTYYFVQW